MRDIYTCWPGAAWSIWLRLGKRGSDHIVSSHPCPYMNPVVDSIARLWTASRTSWALRVSDKSSPTSRRPVLVACT